PNQWTKPYVAPSKRAAQLVQSALIANTGAVNRGIKPRTDMTGFNWATVPSIIVESGFLSNPVEDRLLSSPHYQDKLAQGMADGIVSYLKESR
ncbi:MAG: N-acetylmuramoyl-L-alanine amidase, partial [Actinobacteria bacterium]